MANVRVFLKPRISKSYRAKAKSKKSSSEYFLTEDTSNDKRNSIDSRKENATNHSYIKASLNSFNIPSVSSRNAKKINSQRKTIQFQQKKVKPCQLNDELSNQIKFSDENKIRKKSKISRKYCRCSRLCAFCSILSVILIGTAIVAIVLALLDTSKITNKLSTDAIIDTTMSTTTSTTVTTTTNSETTTTTSTTELTTITYVPTGIWKLHIPTCATWNQTGTTLAGDQNGIAGTTVASLDSPASIFVDNNYTLYVADRDNSRIIKFLINETNGIVVAGNGTNGSSPNQLNYPKGVAVDQEGAIIVADSDNYRIQRFPLGSINGITIANNNSWNKLGQMRDLHVDVNNNIYITDSDYSRVVKFISGSGIGITLAPTGGVGNGANQFSTPFGNFIDADQNLYVADFNNHRIQKWPPGATSGITVAGTGTSGSTSNQLKKPQALIVDNNGYIYIVDNGNNRIMRWTTNYTTGGTCLIGCTGIAGATPTQLSGPRDLKFDAAGNLYVCDQKNNRVQKYEIIYPPNCTANITTSSG